MTKLEEKPSLDKLGEDIRKLQSEVAPKPRFRTTGGNVAVRTGLELLSGALVGLVAGYFLDKWLGTGPIFLIICFFLGSAGGFLNVMRALNEAGSQGIEETKIEKERE